jgi:predicted DsbA family dithiol-disulfide isomerase
MHVDVIADVVCPWCYLGWHNLRRAMETRPHIPFDLLWRPFLLDGNAPQAGTDKAAYYAQRFGEEPEKIKAMHEGLKAAAAEAGAPLNLDAQKIVPNTIDAHRVLVWAFGDGRGVEAVDRFFAAYFVEGKNLSDLSVLVQLGADIGLDAKVLDDMLRQDFDRDVIINSHNSAIEMGVGGVPAFIFNDKTAAMGARPVEDYVKAIDEAVAT